MVVVATNLLAPPIERQFRCWRATRRLLCSQHRESLFVAPVLSMTVRVVGMISILLVSLIHIEASDAWSLAVIIPISTGPIVVARSFPSIE